MTRQHRLLGHLAALQNDTDLILIDTAAGISSSVVSFCLAADHVLVVTTPEATAMTDAYGMIKVLVRKGFPPLHGREHRTIPLTIAAGVADPHDSLGFLQ